MTDVEIEFLTLMHQKLWTKTVTKTNLWTRRPETEKVHDRQEMSKSDRSRVLELLKQYQNELIFEPCGAQFGLGIAMKVYLPPQYPHLPPTFLLKLEDSHLHPGTNAYNRDTVYKIMEPFIYSEGNKQARKLAGFTEELRELPFYDY